MSNSFSQGICEKQFPGLGIIWNCLSLLKDLKPTFFIMYNPVNKFALEINEVIYIWGQKNNTLVSGNAGDEKIFTRAAAI